MKNNIKDAQEQYETGNRFYAEGDYNQAAEWYAKAAKQNHAEAQYMIGFCYENGQGVKQNEDKALDWFVKSAGQGDPDAQYKIAESFMRYEESWPDAIEWYESAAEQGHREAQFQLGFCFGTGKGVERDDEQSAYWYEKAAEQGHDTAQTMLGFYYYNGDGVEQDYEQAVYWFTQAAKQNQANAQLKLGSCYDEGKGVEQDIEKAVYWYKKSAELGNAQAQLNMGICYDNGEGVKQDKTQAVYWFKKAAEQGNKQAAEALAATGGTNGAEDIIGCTAFALWADDGYYYPATIQEKDGDQLRFIFLDGSEDWVNIQNTLTGDEKMTYEANYKNRGEYYPCIITDTSGKKLTVQYIEDNTTEKVELSQLRGLPATGNSGVGFSSSSTVSSSGSSSYSWVWKCPKCGQSNSTNTLLCPTCHTYRY